MSNECRVGGGRSQKTNEVSASDEEEVDSEFACEHSEPSTVPLHK